MTSDRIKEIQSSTAYPDSVSVKQALLQVWNECEQEQKNNSSVENIGGEECIHEWKFISNFQLGKVYQCCKCNKWTWIK